MSKIKKLEKKLKECEDIIKELNGEIEETETIYVEKDNDGYTTKLVKTKLDPEPYTIIDNGKDLNELNMDEYNTIMAQNELHKYDKTYNFCKKANDTWNLGTFIAGISTFVIGGL